MNKFFIRYGNIYIILSFVLILLLINIENFFKDRYGESSLLSKFNDKKNNSFNFIAHAGGGFKSKTYTNSKPAVLNAVKNGFKLIELDLLVTPDKDIIAAHDWNSFYNLCRKILNPSELISVSSYEEFHKCSSQSEMKLINQWWLKNFLDKNQDILIVTDQIQDFKFLHTKFSAYDDRFIVEAHSILGYLTAKQYFPYAALTFNDGRRYKYFTNFFNIKYIIIKSGLLSKYKSHLNKLIKKGTIVMMHTSNDEKFINENLDVYVSMFYTDFWDFNNNKCTENIIDKINNSPCHTY